MCVGLYSLSVSSELIFIIQIRCILFCRKQTLKMLLIINWKFFELKKEIIFSQIFKDQSC